MADHKKILFILHLPPPVHGAAMVGKYIHDSRLINSRYDCRFINLAIATGLEDIGRFKAAKIDRFMRLLKQIRQEVRSFVPDLVYVSPNSHGTAFYKDFVVVQMLKAMGCRVVAHFHNKGVSTGRQGMVDKFLYKRYFKGLKVILLSERLYADMAYYVRRQDVSICPNGIPEIAFPLSSKKTDDKVHLLFMSNLLVDKGVFTLLDALKFVMAANRDFVCDIVGAETAEISRERLENEIKLRRLGSNVSYHGPKYGKDKEACMTMADIFVFPTRREAFPLVCLEAMQHSLPIITTDEAGIPDMVIDGTTGMICQREDVKGLAHSIITLLDDSKLRSDMGRQGLERYQRLFTLERFEHKMCEALDKIL